MSKPVLFLDMDGVVVDWVGGCLKALRIDPEVVFEHPWPSPPTLQNFLDIPDESFWYIIDPLGDAFWANLEPYAHFRQLYDGLLQDFDVMFCTDPRHSHHAASGKMQWLHKHCPGAHERLILTRHKHLLAGPRRFLLDDWPDNVAAFTAAGGTGVLFEQPWNKPMREGNYAAFTRDLLITLHSQV